MAIKIYKTDLSPPCRAVMMLCDILGLEMELIDINLKAKEHVKPEFIKKNPMHTVPVVEDGDVCIQDSHAAMMYLVDKYGKDDSLYPRDLARRAAVHQRLFYNNGVLFPRLRRISFALFAHGIDVVPRAVVEDVHEAYGFLEEFLTRSKYVAGSSLTIADIATFALISSAFKVTPIDKYTKIKNWAAAIENESYVKKYNAPGVAAIAEFTKTLKIEGT